jgi:hypothetical protein
MRLNIRKNSHSLTITRRTPTRLIPNDVNFITWSEYHNGFQRLRRQYRRKVPIEIKEIGRSDEGNPILHISIGSGRNHHLRVDAVHSNEAVCLLSSLYEARYYCRNPKLLKANDMTIDFVCADPDGLIANETWIGAENLDMLTYALGYFRFQAPHHQVEWSCPIEFDGHSWSTPAVGTKAILDLEAGIRSRPGHRIRTMRSGHNEHLLNGVYFMASGTQAKALKPQFFRAAERNGIPLESAPADEVHSLEEWTAFCAYPTLKNRWAWFRGRGVDGGASLYEYLSKKHPGLLGVMAEIPIFVPTKIDGSLHHLSMGEANQKRNDILSNLPNLIEQAVGIVANLPATDPLVVAVKETVGEEKANWWGDRDEDLSRLLSPEEAFETVGRGLFFLARVAGLLIRVLKKYEQSQELRDQMTEEVRRIIETIEQVGAVKAVSPADAARLQLDIAAIATKQTYRKQVSLSRIRRTVFGRNNSESLKEIGERHSEKAPGRLQRVVDRAPGIRR